ncbi:M23 family metallopeptidase [Tsuneonella sp. YG55]|uniref:M23 family metallopeptidase n=1 Tax=Tsuneonella litorea TaxID=2976475 RepID=A0A9X2W149_9SPHN|nr:M23 family metallopeptidase [Tsuneonella litorea]MCT2558116.1 M23 family metallopeptidase [Tsuneonella litorea]
MALRVLDRVLTIVVTATLTSAAWIVFGGTLMERARGVSQVEKTRPAAAAPSPAPTASEGAPAVPSLDTADHTAPPAGNLSSLMIPVLGVRPGELTDTFTDERGGGERLHSALDIMAPEGTTVVATAPGSIERLFLSDAGGKTIYVRSSDGRTIYYYAHLKDYAQGLKEGQKIRRGQRLGSVGSTGNASAEAPHLHFAIMRTTPEAKWWEPATAINPYPLLAKPAS